MPPYHADEYCVPDAQKVLGDGRHFSPELVKFAFFEVIAADVFHLSLHWTAGPNVQTPL